MSNFFPEEIVIQILAKLPVKSLIWFRSVCKAWRSIIGRPSFVSAHISSYTLNQTLVRLHDVNDVQEHYAVFPKGVAFSIKSSREIDFPIRCPIDYFKIVGSCGGLLCLSNDRIVDPSPPVIIWNPAMRHHVVLPLPIVNPKGSQFVVYGFGSASNVYKVVRIVFYASMAPPQAQIFSLGTGRWRKLNGFNARVPLLKYNWCPIFFKGFVHWIAYEQPRGENSYRSSILTFHVDDEVFGETMLPEELERRSVRSLSLSIMGESLAAIKCGGEMGNRSCHVWMMKDYGVRESWTRLYRIDFEKLDTVIGFWGSGEALLAVQECEIVTYNAQTKGIKHVEVFGRIPSFSAVDYKESLLLPRGFSGDSWRS